MAKSKKNNKKKVKKNSNYKNQVIEKKVPKKTEKNLREAEKKAKLKEKQKKKDEKLLAKKGIDCSGKRARQMTRADYDYYDLLIGMDNWNIRNMLRITGGDPDNKIKMLLDFTNRPGEVADPWYSGDFEATYRDVLEGCEGILRQY